MFEAFFNSIFNNSRKKVLIQNPRFRKFWRLKIRIKYKKCKDCMYGILHDETSTFLECTFLVCLFVFTAEIFTKKIFFSSKLQSDN